MHVRVFPIIDGWRVCRGVLLWHDHQVGVTCCRHQSLTICGPDALLAMQVDPDYEALPSAQVEVLGLCQLPRLAYSMTVKRPHISSLPADYDIFSVQVGYRQMIHQLQVQAQLRERLRGQFVPQRKTLLLSNENEILLQQQAIFGHTIFCGGLLIDLVEVNDQALLDTEYRIGLLVWIAAKIYSTNLTTQY